MESTRHGCKCQNSKENVSKSIENESFEEINGLNDDIWGEDEDLEKTMQLAELKRIQVSKGYVDGIAEAKEKNLQKAFDDSYPDGSDLGKKVGYILGQLMCEGNNELLHQAKEELKLQNILQNQYYDQNLELRDEAHPEISKWESKVNISR